MKRNYSGVLTIALVLLLIAITALTFAYWDQLTNNGSGSIIIGEGKKIEVTRTVVAGEGKTLIPEGTLQGVSDVYFVEEEFNVSFNTELDENALEGYKLYVTLVSVNLANDESDPGITDVYGLVKFNLNGKIMNIKSDDLVLEVNASQENIINVVVSLKNPTSKEESDSLVGKTIKYTLNFLYEKVN